MRAILQSRSSSTAHSKPALQQRPRAARRGISRSHRLPVVATSEFWWEDEQEFDALTEVLLPKQVVICTPQGCQQNLQRLKPIQFVAAFCSPADQQEAAQLWEQLGRAGPPLFLKVRAREALQLLEQEDASSSSSSSSSTAEQFWQELAGQSWRMDLDYGLNKDATSQALTEQLLVIVSSSKGLQSLAAAAVDEHNSSSSSSSSGGSEGFCVVELSGWNQGEKQQELQGWKQLQPKVGQLSADTPVQA